MAAKAIDSIEKADKTMGLIQHFEACELEEQCFFSRIPETDNRLLILSCPIDFEYNSLPKAFVFDVLPGPQARS